MKHKAETKEDIARIINILSLINLQRPKSVVIEDWVDKRSDAQNSLYWLWMSEIVRHIHDSKGTLHDVKTMSEIMKEELYPQIECDKILIISFVVKKKGIAEDRVRYLSTTELGVKLMAMYLDMTDMWCITRLGLQLTHPSDIYNEALGRKA